LIDELRLLISTELPSPGCLGLKERKKRRKKPANTHLALRGIHLKPLLWVPFQIYPVPHTLSQEQQGVSFQETNGMRSSVVISQHCVPTAIFSHSMYG
jgi:hypothetical protein